MSILIENEKSIDTSKNEKSIDTSDSQNSISDDNSQIRERGNDMLKMPKILYFCKTGLPTVEERQEAAHIKGQVVFRNASAIADANESVSPEECDGVAGEVPEIYEGFPSAEEAFANYERSLQEKADLVADEKAPRSSPGVSDAWGNPQPTNDTRNDRRTQAQPGDRRTVGNVDPSDPNARNISDDGQVLNKPKPDTGEGMPKQPPTDDSSKVQPVSDTKAPKPNPKSGFTK